MTSAKRYALVAIGIIFFGIAVPILILAIQGYIYDFNSRTLIKTGIIVARTEPRGATITVESANRSRVKTSPATFRFLLPGDYVVTIEHENHHAWQKRLNVRAGVVTWITDRGGRKVLLPKNPTLVRESTQAPEDNRLSAPSFTYTLQANSDFPDRFDLIGVSANNPDNKIILAQNMPVHPDAEIITSPAGLVFLLSNRTLYQVSEGLEYLADGVALAQWNNNAGLLVYGNSHELSFYNPFDPGPGQRELIIRTSEVGGTFCVMPELGYVLRTYGNVVRAIELDGRDRRNIYDFLHFENIPEIIECSSNGRGVIIKDGGIYKTYNLR